METVPSLCASGTLGVAAVGLALGHPQHSIAARPTSKKRRMPSRVSLHDSRSLQDMPTTPVRSAQPASAPTSKLQKRTSAGRPLTSPGNIRGGIRTLESTHKTRLNHGPETETGTESHPSLLGAGQSFEHGSFAFESKDAENTPPKWLRRKSTHSSLKNGNPEPSPRPDTASVSYSNGSTAPMLSNFPDSPHGHPSRNKLVKRSSSQRLLYSSNKSHSTLRRPATSHQRSATLQQQFQQEEKPSRSSITASSLLPNQAAVDEEPMDKDPQLWIPSFKARSVGEHGNSTSMKRSSIGTTYRNDTIKTIRPDMTEVATLLMATSLSPEPSNSAPNGRASSISRLTRPFTSSGLNTFTSSESDDIQPDDVDFSELKSRHSFSLSEMFPFPSPSTWKMPRTGSLKKTKPFVRDSSGRRAVSAPQSNPIHKTMRPVQSQSDFGKINATNIDAKNSTNNSRDQEEHSSAQYGSPSSPLPPLNRLSSFEITLPNSVPSYPSTPQLEKSPSPQDPYPRSSSWMSSPLGSSTSKIRNQRISSALSEPGSTLLGSDNDNSRLMSGDEDDLDSRSETIYDSTRTGATDSSHSGMRRPPIDTIFDESPPPKLPSKSKLIDLEDLVHHNDSFKATHTRGSRFEEEQAVSTPVRAAKKREEDDSPTPINHDNEIFLASRGDSSPSSEFLTEIKTSARDIDPDQDDELWAFENAEISHAEAVHIRNISLTETNSPLGSSSPYRELPQRSSSPKLVNGQEKTSKANIFEWSEQPHVEKDSSRSGSPRPKTVHGRQGKEMRGSHSNGRRGPSALHLRSQSVPVQKDMTKRRSHNNPSNLDSWVLGNKGPKEDWDDDFEFEEAPRANRQAQPNGDSARPSLSSGMLVPRNILERQASVHGQFGQVKELALLVEDLKRLQQQASGQGIMEGQSVELWKEAEGIINLATLDDDEQEIFPPQSPHSPSFDFDNFDEDSPSIRNRRRSGKSQPSEDHGGAEEDSPRSQPQSRPSHDLSGAETPPRPTSRSRKDSSAKAKSVLETIHHQRSPYNGGLLETPYAQKKLPFDTTSLKDLVTRAGVVTRALKEIVRRAENGPETPEPRSSTPRDPPYISQMFHQPPISPTLNKTPLITQSPKSPKSPKGSKGSKSPKSPRSQRSGTFMGGNLSTNDNEINAHIKMMTVV